MEDYSKKSDFELSKLVLFKSGKPYEDYEANPFPEDSSSFSYGDGVNRCEFDINNPSDMWPLIVENGIGIVKYNLTAESSEYEDYKDMWFAEKGLACTADDKNPLRAAAIVFLMLNED